MINLDEIQMHYLGFEFVEAVSISPRPPLTATACTQTNAFEDVTKLVDVSIQATVPSFNQATSPFNQATPPFINKGTSPIPQQEDSVYLNFLFL